MAGSIMVRYARKTYKQQKADSVEDFRNLNHSVDIIPESMSVMTFETQKEAGKFASSIRDDGYHVIEIIDK
jgi:hypothetical protein